MVGTRSKPAASYFPTSANESGKYRGKAIIRRGRPRVRAELSMSAFNARRKLLVLMDSC